MMIKRHKNLWLRLYEYTDVGGGVGHRIHPRHTKLSDICRKWLTYSVRYDYKNHSNKSKEYKEISEWCNENFSSKFCLWDDLIYCQHEEDAMAFKLRWL